MIIWISSFKLMLIPHIDNTFGRVVGYLYGPWSCFYAAGHDPLFLEDRVGTKGL